MIILRAPQPKEGMPSTSLTTPSSGQSTQLMESALGAVPLQLPATGAFRTTSTFFQRTSNYFLGFSTCLFPEPRALSGRLTCWTMKSLGELLTVELTAATTKAGRQHFMYYPYAAHLKLIQQQKVQMERAQLLLF